MTSPQQMQSQVLDYVKQGQQAALDAVTLMTTIWGGPATPTTHTASTPASSTPASTAGSPADEQVSAAASDAVARAAGLTAARTRS